MPPAEQGTRLAALAITLRRRSPWEAMDLGFTMLRRWWRPVYTAHALVFVPLAALVLALCWASGTLWLAMLVLWWLEPLYDRVVLHVLSRAVFGGTPSWREVWRQGREWLGTGLFQALSFERLDLARSFNLPVRQLEGSRGRERRARKAVLGRRTRSYAVWLTVVWIHFEALLMWSADALASLLLPAQLERSRGGDGDYFARLFELAQRAELEDAIVYALVIFALEPFYVAAGFALYLNRRTLLEGWDIELALRRIAERHAIAGVVVAVALSALLVPPSAHSQEKIPREEIAEVLKAKEFGYQREVERWQPKAKDSGAGRDGVEPGWLALGKALAKALEVLLWVAAGALIAYALWWAARMLPRHGRAQAEPYRPPPALFGMELAPETLPSDVGAAASALAREGRLRDALSLLYRGALSELVHKRGVQLLASHTEGAVLRLSGDMPYLRTLVHTWLGCAYARRMPATLEVERLANEYEAAFA